MIANTASAIGESNIESLVDRMSRRACFLPDFAAARHRDTGKRLPVVGGD